MTVRSSRPRVTKLSHTDTEKKIHYTFDTFGDGSVSGMRSAAKNHAEKQPNATSENYKFMTVSFIDGHYIIK
jgi:hypothetical protein